MIARSPLQREATPQRAELPSFIMMMGPQLEDISPPNSYKSRGDLILMASVGYLAVPPFPCLESGACLDGDFSEVEARLS